MKKITTLFVLLCLSITTILAQNKTVNGTVISASDNLPLPGVTVIIKGSKAVPPVILTTPRILIFPAVIWTPATVPCNASVTLPGIFNTSFALKVAIQQVGE